MASEEIDGEHPSEKEIIERNVRQATANATAATEQPRPHRPVTISEASSEPAVAAAGDDEIPY